jgi:hypothetical protein
LSDVEKDVAQDVQKNIVQVTMKESVMMTRLVPMFTGAAAALVLAAIFAAYLRPGFMLDLGNRFFMCF